MQQQSCKKNQQKSVSRKKGARVEEVKKWKEKIIAVMCPRRTQLTMDRIGAENVLTLGDRVMQLCFSQTANEKIKNYCVGNSQVVDEHFCSLCKWMEYSVS